MLVVLTNVGLLAVLTKWQLTPLSLLPGVSSTGLQPASPMMMGVSEQLEVGTASRDGQAKGKQRQTESSTLIHRHHGLIFLHKP